MLAAAEPVGDVVSGAAEGTASQGACSVGEPLHALRATGDKEQLAASCVPGAQSDLHYLGDNSAVRNNSDCGSQWEPAMTKLARKLGVN